MKTVRLLNTWMGNSEAGLEEQNAVWRLLWCSTPAGGSGERDLEHHIEPWLPHKKLATLPANICRTRAKQGEDDASKGYLWPDSFPGTNHSQSKRCLKTQIIINFTENSFLVMPFMHLQRSQLEIPASVCLKFIVIPVIPRPYGGLCTEGNYMIHTPPGHLLPPQTYWIPCWTDSYSALLTVIAVRVTWSCGLRHFQGNLSAIISGDGKESFSMS